MSITTTKELYKSFSESTGICTDTRKIDLGCMFFALKGPNFNANTMAESALAKGAMFAVVDEPAFATQPNIFLVENGLKALQDLANYHRKQFNIPIIGLTGSNGKTTTKELIYSVLSKNIKHMQLKAT